MNAKQEQIADEQSVMIHMTTDSFILWAIMMLSDKTISVPKREAIKREAMRRYYMNPEGG